MPLDVCLLVCVRCLFIGMFSALINRPMTYNGTNVKPPFGLFEISMQHYFHLKTMTYRSHVAGHMADCIDQQCTRAFRRYPIISRQVTNMNSGKSRVTLPFYWKSFFFYQRYRRPVAGFNKACTQAAKMTQLWTKIISPCWPLHIMLSSTIFVRLIVYKAFNGASACIELIAASRRTLFAFYSR